MGEVVTDILKYLVAHYELYLVVMMGLLIMIVNTILMFMKKPIKKLTGKIQNSTVRKLANKMFIFFAFGLSAILWYALSKISSEYFSYDEIRVLLTGAFSTVVYALGDGIVNKPKAEKLVETIKDIAKDGTVNDNDKSAVEEFYNIVK